MSCNNVRQQLTATVEGKRPAGLEKHLEGCRSCLDYATRLQTARQLLAEHRSDAQPDAAFAARVVARLEKPPLETLGWAAARLLPATLALVLALAWFVFNVEPLPTSEETAAPTEDLVSWVLELSENGS
jgi:predicted anti-sigma-YlaC factor YlaD